MKESPINVVVDLFLDAGSTYQESEQMLRSTLLRRALHRTKGNICHAAALVGMHRNHFFRELEAMQMSDLPAMIREATRLEKPQENVQINLRPKPAARSRSTRAA